MYNFDGISLKTINLLSENMFEDNKAFYEEHKEEIKAGAVVPMRQIMLDLSEDLFDIDDLMYTNPIYTVARVRRDTRRTKNKRMYRENLWIMFRRNKKIYPNAPTFWFEFTPNGYSYGIGFWCPRPAQMDEIRKLIEDKPNEFRKAKDKLLNNGFAFSSNKYKKDKNPNIHEDLKEYYNSKDMSFMHFDSDLRKIGSKSLIDELKQFLKTATPMYKFFIEGYENMMKEGLISD